MSSFRNKELFIDTVKNSKSISEVILKLDLKISGGNYKQVHKYCSLYKISLPRVNPNSQTKKAIDSLKLDANKIFTKDNKVNRKTVKREFKKLVPYECSVCGLKEWQGKSISLQIDHINGIPNDNRIKI